VPHRCAGPLFALRCSSRSRGPGSIAAAAPRAPRGACRQRFMPPATIRQFRRPLSPSPENSATLLPHPPQALPLRPAGPRFAQPVTTHSYRVQPRIEAYGALTRSSRRPAGGIEHDAVQHEVLQIKKREKRERPSPIRQQSPAPTPAVPQNNSSSGDLKGTAAMAGPRYWPMTRTLQRQPLLVHIPVRASRRAEAPS